MNPIRLLALAMASLGIAATPLSSRAAELVAMTFNLRYASPKPPNSWPERRPAVKACLDQYSPDLIGTQEGLYDQLRDIAADQPNYQWIGLGRDGGSRGEFMAIFYRRDRFDALEYDHFWLSDTPEVMASSTWGNTNRRMVTWVRFKDRRDNREFYFWNTHLDHALQPAREKAAALIRQRIEALKKPALPVLLVGDFNAVSGANKTYDILLDGGFLKDTWHLALERKNAEFDTFNDFRTPQKNGQRIDWILLRGDADVASTEIVTFTHNGQVPSDHFPVISRLTLK